MTTQEEFNQLEKDLAPSIQAEFNQTAARFQEALQATAEAEAETQRAAEAWRARLLSLFVGDPGYIHDALTNATDPGPEFTAADATAKNFSLNATPLGFTAVNWYRQAARDFEEGDYTAALDIFINAETVDRIRPGINAAIEERLEKDGLPMTLADFLTRQYGNQRLYDLFDEYGYNGNGTEEEHPPEFFQAVEEYSREIGAGELAPDPSIFDNLVAKIAADTGKAGHPTSRLYLKDKVTRNLPNLSTNGARDSLRVDNAKDRRKKGSKEINIYINWDLSETRAKYPELAEQLEKVTFFDVEVYCALASIWRDWEESGKPGGPYCHFSGRDILEALPFKTPPNGANYKRVNTAIKKFMSPFTIDNREEKDAGYTKKSRGRPGYGTYNKKTRQLLYISWDEEADEKTGGTKTGEYTLYAEPYLLEFAQSRNQITAVTIERGNKIQMSGTERRYRLDYLFVTSYLGPAKERRRKEHLKTARGVINLDKVYKEFGASTVQEKKRIRDDLADILEGYRDNGDIKTCTTSRNRKKGDTTKITEFAFTV